MRIQIGQSITLWIIYYQSYEGENKMKKVKVRSTGRFRINGYPAIEGIIVLPENIAEEVIKNHPADFRLVKIKKIEVKKNDDTANRAI